MPLIRVRRCASLGRKLQVKTAAAVQHPAFGLLCDDQVIRVLHSRRKITQGMEQADRGRNDLRLGLAAAAAGPCMDAVRESGRFHGPGGIPVMAQGRNRLGAGLSAVRTAEGTDARCGTRGSSAHRAAVPVVTGRGNLFGAGLPAVRTPESTDARSGTGGCSGHRAAVPVVAGRGDLLGAGLSAARAAEGADARRSARGRSSHRAAVPCMLSRSRNLFCSSFSAPGTGECPNACSNAGRRCGHLAAVPAVAERSGFIILVHSADRTCTHYVPALGTCGRTAPARNPWAPIMLTFISIGRRRYQCQSQQKCQ